MACSLVSYLSRVARINVTEQVLASESRHAARRRKNASSISDPPCMPTAESNKFKPDGRGLDVPDWILDQLTTTEHDAETGEGVTFELIFRRWCCANLKAPSIRAATDFLNDELL